MATNAKTITLTLVGKADGVGAVFFSDFRAFCDSVADCLKRSELVVTGRHGSVSYRIADLKMGSASVTLEAVKAKKGRDRCPAVLNFFRKQVGAIQRGKIVDPRLGVDDLRAFRKLAAPLHRRSREIMIDDASITKDFERNLDRLLRETFPVEGFVSGKLERLNLHERNEFVIFPPIQGYSIVCTFADAMLDSVREAIRRTVTVHGTLHYAQDSPFPRSVTVRMMEIHPHDNDLPTLMDLRGAGLGCTGDMTAVEYVRSVRDD